METEIWKPVFGYECLYEVSSLGMVKSIYFNKILKLGLFFNGYSKISLTLNKARKTYKVHRLVAQAFITNPENKEQVNHKNGIKTDNRIENLEWCTRSENQKHSYLTGLNKKRFGIKNDKSKKINQYSLGGDLIKNWDSTMDIERDIGIYHGNISSCCKGRYKTAGGFIWKYTSQIQNGNN